MGSEDRAPKIHVLSLPLPFQGHINPMFQLSKRLASKGLQVTLAAFTNEEFTTKGEHDSVNIEFIHNDTDIPADDDYFKNLQARTSKELPEIIAKHGDSGCPISCLLYDSLMPWVLDIARQHGIYGASLHTQPCGVTNVFYKVYEGKLKVPIEQTPVCIEGMPPLEIDGLPSFVADLEKYPSSLSIMGSQFSNFGKADWIFFNTFNGLEDEVLNWMARQCPIKPIGPTVPSIYLDNRVEDNKDYGLSLFKPNTESCTKWLNSRETGSVVYVSFGSITNLEQKQMEEMAYGLKRSNHHFLWVVRETEREKLPSNFVDEISDRGIIVTWCSQLEVLSHKSIGCFMTHCGWNSTIEALSLGVPMVAMPQWADQTTNAKYVADVWKTGVRVKINEAGIVTKEELETCIRKVMEGETKNEIRRNCEKWKKMAKQAVDKGGSSDKNIDEFVAKLVFSSNVVDKGMKKTLDRVPEALAV